METTESCNICGCTETDLVDGFYYCAECGTQDTNVRETHIETVVVDGAVAKGTRKRITQIPKAAEVQMTDDWYKWHSLNFLLKGLADELIELGASPSFKIKLLWIWTRYMKKYQNKADFGLATNEESDHSEEDEEKPTKDENVYSSDDEEHTRPQTRYNYLRNIEKISMPLVISFLYVALNLDKSRIQLAHLIRYMREGRLSIMHWRKLVPAEMRPKMLRKSLFMENRRVWFSLQAIRASALELFRKLDLGNPIVPDLRPLVEEYLQELCLPNDLKPLVFSLMHYRSFDYLDINVKYKELRYMPSYELHVMSHILLAVKICFGLDCEYEVKLSDAVDKINELEDNPRSYNSQATERLFNFRDWCSYIQFRKTLLRTHTLYLGEPHYFDMNDYVAFEHQSERPDFKINLKDEIALDIINKIPTGELNVIPKSEFLPTMKPHTTNTRVILEHTQDPNVKQLLSEDFTQYSLKYIIEDMFLVDPNSTNPKNIITGVSELNMQKHKSGFELLDPSLCFSKEMVYIKDCDNHNWMVTQRPQLEHVITAGKISDSDEKENDHGYVSNTETLPNVMKDSNINLDDTQKSKEVRENSVVTFDNNSKVPNDLSNITDFEKETEKEERNDDAMIVDNNITNIDSDSKLNGVDEDIQTLKIREEDAGKNIFDDDFVDLETKKEENKNPEEMELQETDQEYNDNDVPCEINRSINIRGTSTQDYWTHEKDSDVSSVDSIHLNPESLDRDEAIKELVIHACNKCKVSLPGIYAHRKTRIKSIQKKVVRTVKPKFKGETTLKINGLISDYLSHLQEDVLHQMSNMVQAAISDFNKTIESEKPVESEDFPHVGDGIDGANDQAIENEPSDTGQDQNPDQHASAIEDNHYNLFGDSSDGETHAEDLLPKKNPEFDEETHDIRQLYIKPDENPSVPEMRLNPNLFKIVDRNIEADKNEGEPQQKKKKTEVKDSDSEEDTSIIVLQEQKRIREQLTDQQNRTKANRLRPLIRSDVPPYNIWLRHYKSEYMTLDSGNQRFANEIDVKLPKSFVFVLKECADVVGYPVFIVYKRLQRVEGCFKGKFLKRTNVDMSYSVKRFRKYEDFW